MKYSIYIYEGDLSSSDLRENLMTDAVIAYCGTHDIGYADVTVERAEKNARDLVAKLEAEEKAQTDSFKADVESIRAHVSELAKEREGVVAQISAQNLAAYDAACKRFGGIAVETLVGNRPSVCRVALQPSSYTDIRRSNAEVTTCPYCKRVSKEE